ncbi:MAG: ATP-binding protein, partial [Alphaproteobacteria bacterium]|nr:ATP-binding protein [Alphaproteobacteria bacterium]
GSPERLAKHIRTQGWEPADARLTVSDVPAIVEMLGGKKLYGDNPTVALRELIQNACDAIRARRILERRLPEWGEVRIRFRETDEGTWLEVADNGIGMGRRILTGPLLNFGQSFWRSSMMTDEFPGLSAGGMRATGQFGIGFFSVFMLGNRVTVTSRRYDAAASDALTLEFGAGVAGRPLVRRAHPAERPNDGGSVVRVLLTIPPEQQGGLLHATFLEDWRPEALIAYLAPAVDATLIFESDVKSEICVRAGDWKTISDQSLLSRMAWSGGSESEIGRMRALVDADGRIHGRAFIDQNSSGAILVGGLRAAPIKCFGGILSGKPVTAARDRASLTAPSDVLARWATEQAELIQSHEEGLSQIVHAFGGNTRRLPVALVCGAYLDADGFRRHILTLNEIYVVLPFFLHEKTILRSDIIVPNVRELPDLFPQSAWDDLVVSIVKDAWGGFQREVREECIGTVDDCEIVRPVIHYTRT